MLRLLNWPDLCRSGLASRKGRKAAPAIFATTLRSRGCCAALSRHKAAPTGWRSTHGGPPRLLALFGFPRAKDALPWPCTSG
ncbi:hypothetical protein DMX06_01475 [Pseudomonas mosselii]|nr:hypothetical protein DMX06_01475 [Pseudomonas mosselii]